MRKMDFCEALFEEKRKYLSTSLLAILAKQLFCMKKYKLLDTVSQK